MSGPCTDCGGPDYQTLEARIAELVALVDALTDEVSDERDLYDGVHARIAALEAENEEWIGYFDACYTDMCHYKDRAVQAEAVASSSDTLLGEATRWAKDARERAEQAEATIERLKTALVAIQSTTPGSAHRIAIQALAERSAP